MSLYRPTLFLTSNYVINFQRTPDLVTLIDVEQTFHALIVYGCTYSLPACMLVKPFELTGNFVLHSMFDNDNSNWQNEPTADIHVFFSLYQYYYCKSLLDKSQQQSTYKRRHWLGNKVLSQAGFAYFKTICTMLSTYIACIRTNNQEARFRVNKINTIAHYHSNGS